MATIQIADNDARKQYTQAVTANTTQLVIDFPFFSLDDIEVVVTSAAGTDTTLTRGTGAGTFAVVGTAVDDGFSGGYITLGDTYSDAATKFTIFRDIPIARTTDFPTSGPFNVASLNTQLDKIFAIEQELETQITRSFKLPESDSGTAVLPNVAARSNKYLAFDSNGNPIASDGTVNATPINSAMQPFVQSSSVTDARALLLAGSNLTIPSGGFDVEIQSTRDINLTPGTNDKVFVNTDGARSFQAGNIEIQDNLIQAANGQGELRLEPNGAGPLLINGSAVVTEDTGTGTILSVHGTSTQGMIELVSEASANSASDVGKIQFNMTNNNATYKACAEVAVVTSGSTNGQRGGNILLKTRDNASSTMSERMRVDRSGNIMMGTTSVGGTSILSLGSSNYMVATHNDGGTSGFFGQIRFRNNANNADVGTINRVNDASVQYNTTSDARLKENISDMTGAITRVKQLAPKRYSWVNEDLDAADQDGFLAHEAQTVVPVAVSGTQDEVDGDGNPIYMQMDYSKLVPLLTGALKEAITKIEALEARVTTLENA
jgi:hypothetical protein|tara:strand:+ start:90 stop:1733 length:1644 start_codon:yes stop_codon:yes gene_type:complete